MLSYEQIKDWANMPLNQRYNMLLGAVVVVLVGVIMFFSNEIKNQKVEYQAAVNSLNTRYTAREAALETKLDICNQERLQRLIKSEQEYRELLFQAKKLKEKLNENTN